MSLLKNFSKTEKSILAGAVLLLVGFSFLLCNDSFILPHDNGANLEVIGTLSSSENDVRRKNVDNFIWYPGNKKDQIYNRDSIFTGDTSSADIQLQDGSLIHIQENSLVNLNMKNGQMQLDLRFGQFVGDAKNGSLKVKAGDEEYTVKGNNAKFEINRGQNGALDFKVLSGDAEVDGKKGKQVLKSHETLKIGKDGINKGETEADIHLLTKDNTTMYRNGDKDPLGFEWDPRGTLDQFQIDISKTPDFKHVVSTNLTADTKIQVLDSLTEGPYYWRVQGLDGRRKPLVTSKSEKFFLSYLKAPQVTFPQKDANLKVTSLPDKEGHVTGSTRVTWSADPRLSGFELQVAEDTDFKKITSQKNSSEKEAVATNLLENAYYARVRGYDKDHHASPWSEPLPFKLQIVAEQKPPAPRLIEAKTHFQIPKAKDRVPSAETAPKLAWEEVAQASNYHWEFSRTANFQAKTSGDTEDTHLLWPNPKAGHYYYRVYTRSDLGQLSDPSQVGELEVFGGQPVLEPVPSKLVKDSNPESAAPAQDFKLNWSQIPDAQSYVVQYDTDPNFTKPTEIQSKETQAVVRVKDPGQYHARVKAVGADGKDLSDFSDVGEIKYTFHRLLRAPALVEPFDKTTIFMQKDTDPFIWLEWQKVPSAVKYVVEASANADFTHVLISKTVTETRFLVRDRVPYGTIYWRVRALAEDAELSSEWAQRNFSIYHQKNEGL